MVPSRKISSRFKGPPRKRIVAQRILLSRRCPRARNRNEIVNAKPLGRKTAFSVVFSFHCFFPRDIEIDKRKIVEQRAGVNPKTQIIHEHLTYYTLRRDNSGFQYDRVSGAGGLTCENFRVCSGTPLSREIQLDFSECPTKSFKFNTGR